jgi:hypothetical protein
VVWSGIICLTVALGYLQLKKQTGDKFSAMIKMLRNEPVTE